MSRDTMATVNPSRFPDVILVIQPPKRHNSLSIYIFMLAVADTTALLIDSILCFLNKVADKGRIMKDS